MSALRSKALLLIALLVVSVCMVTFLVVRQERAREDGQVTGEIAGEALPRQPEGDGQVTGETAGEALPEEVEGDGQVAVKIAGDAFPLLFEDDSVPSALKKTIATDLGRALSYLDEARFEKLNRTRRLSRENEDLEVTHRLVTRGQLPNMLPDPLQRDFGEAVGTNGGYALIVRTAVIEAYVRAAELRDQHPDMFGSVDEFIDLLNDQERLKQISRDWETCADYVYRFRSVSEEGALTIVRHFADVRVRPPSLLDIAASSTFGPGAPADLYVMASLIEEGKGRVTRIGRWPVGAYVDGRWRIFTFNPP